MQTRKQTEYEVTIKTKGRIRRAKIAATDSQDASIQASMLGRVMAIKEIGKVNVPVE